MGLTNYFQLARNMGLRYIIYRSGFEIKKKLGLIKRRFPTSPVFAEYVSLESWRKDFRFFGVNQDDSSKRGDFPSPEIGGILNGEIEFFSSLKYQLGRDYDWITNPDTKFKYDIDTHWLDIQDFRSEAGDIKFVWEKSRFAYLLDIIRHDHHTGEDHSEWVFGEIESWLSSNPINKGPNYKCSQEISLRILNWTYALNFYRNSLFLSAVLFAKLMHSIYWQIRHVYSNIDFSRIAVRNNHALTETLTLYLCSLYFPFFPGAKTWGAKGKKWFEEEVNYQIYDDGTFLQFSMNYHRVVVQLFTWAFRTADFFNEKFSQQTYDKAYKSLQFLIACQDVTTGWLPNYGNNDGALFFRMNACNYRDYRPQLNALHVLLTGSALYENGPWSEDILWMNMATASGLGFSKIKPAIGWSEFRDGGYFILREEESLTFIRCGNHKDRPAQADNLHIDVWHKGENLLFDAGTYKYNTDPKNVKYFMGTESHNTVMLGDNDQMVKGNRFIWYNWTQAVNAVTKETREEFYFEGTISAFRHINPQILHSRKIRKYKNKAVWEVVDFMEGKPGKDVINQRWHSLPAVSFSSVSESGASLEAKRENGLRSDFYGLKEPANQVLFETSSNSISTTINFK